MGWMTKRLRSGQERAVADKGFHTNLTGLLCRFPLILNTLDPPSSSHLMYSGRSTSILNRFEQSRENYMGMH